MVDSLRAARAFANKLRYAGDLTSGYLTQPGGREAERVDETFYHAGIEISAALTPILWDQFSAVCERLQIPPGLVKAFVHSSSELQATCRGADAGSCVITFASALINFLNGDEFEFVAGHELGHFLLGHVHQPTSKRVTPEYLMICRSQEISADRVGLHACSSLDTAMRALMKTVSGLSAPHLRFDVAAFISQLKKIDNVTTDQSGSTHPSMVIRSKALLWYSVSDYFCKGEQYYSPDQIRNIDNRIERDLTRFVDGAVKGRIEDTKKNLLLWMLTHEIVKHGMFSKKAQSEMANLFDEDTVSKLKHFLGDLSAQDLEAEVYKRLMATREELESLIPDKFMGEIQKLEKTAYETTKCIIPSGYAA